MPKTFKDRDYTINRIASTEDYEEIETLGEAGITEYSYKYILLGKTYERTEIEITPRDIGRNVVKDVSEDYARIITDD